MRPTKKQKELLDFIESFIADKGYSPSYREIMRGKNYNSVATVASHVGNLIKRGHLRKRDNSARSLELITSSKDQDGVMGNISWLVAEIDDRFAKKAKADDLYVLVGALKVLGYDDLVVKYAKKLKSL